MKSTLLPIIIFFFLCLSCDNSDNINGNLCSVENAIEDLDWLKSKIAEYKENSSDTQKYFYVTRAAYENMTVIIFPNCCPLCNTVTLVYNCSGELLGIVGSREEDIDEGILDRDIIIWKPDDFACSE